jgi:hypothetical protein
VIGPSDTRLIETPAFVWVPPDVFVGTHVYLTTEKLITACAEPPSGTEQRPGVIAYPIPTIQRLVGADDGTFVILAPGQESPTVQTVLNLYPNASLRRCLPSFGAGAKARPAGRLRATGRFG